MKSLKKILFVMMTAIFLFGLIDCEVVPGAGSGNGGHNHRFSDEWETDETYHWHVAICEHSTEDGDKGEHTFGEWSEPAEDGNQTKECTVCGYKIYKIIPILKNGDEFQKAIKAAGAITGYNSNVEKIKFSINPSVSTLLGSNIVDIGTVSNKYYVYYDGATKTIHIVSADKEITKIILNPNSSKMFYDLQKCESIEGFEYCDTSNVTDMSKMFYKCMTLERIDLKDFDTSNVTNMSGMFSGCSNLKGIVYYFNTSKVTDMSSMFSGCYSLGSLYVSFDTSNVTNMAGMFNDFRNGVDVSRLKTSKVTNMSHMFASCNYIEGLDKIDTSKVTDMSGMFMGCIGLDENTDLSNFDTSRVTDMSYMFSGCGKLKSRNIRNFDTSNVTNMRGMFRGTGLTKLDLSNFNTSKVTDMEEMFEQCTDLTELNLSSFNTSKVTNMRYMFQSCSSLTMIDLSTFGTSKVKDMYGMFWGCTELTELDLSTFDTSNVINMCYMFRGCTKLVTIYVKYRDTFVPAGESKADIFKDCGTSELTTKTN